MNQAQKPALAHHIRTPLGSNKKLQERMFSTVFSFKKSCGPKPVFLNSWQNNFLGGFLAPVLCQLTRKRTNPVILPSSHYSVTSPNRVLTLKRPHRMDQDVRWMRAVTLQTGQWPRTLDINMWWAVLIGFCSWDFFNCRKIYIHCTILPF